MGEYDFILFEVNIMKHINRQLLLFIFTLISLLRQRQYWQ
ncbi:Uncharacterised protein [Salmonella bongori]|nr:Uncharacterised protein [Salmonella bongori]